MNDIVASKQLTNGPSVAEIKQTKDPYSLESLISYQRRFGNLFVIPAAHPNGKRVVVVNDPIDIKHILSTNFKNYKKGLGFDRVEVLLGNGLIVSDGPVWHRHRRMIQPSFHPNKLKNFEALMQNCNQRLLQKWEQAYQNQQPVNVTADMSEMTLEIILGAIFSEDLERMSQLHGANPFAIITKEHERNLEFARKFRELTKLIANIIEQRIETERRPFDFLSQFIDARDRKDHQGMSIKEIVNEVTTLIIAGHETTASALNWCWYLLSQDKQIEAQFHAEIDQVAKGSIAGFADLPQLSFCKQIAQEAIRLYPPVWLITRRAIHDDMINDYLIPADTDIFISPYLVHRLASYWPDPENFDPNRFNPEKIQQRDRFAYLPFSAGPRKCIGDYISLCEMQMHLSFIGQRYQLRYNSDQPIELDAAVNLRTKHPLHMQLIKREQLN